MRRAYQHQQIVLKFLGYYDGKCDGIWGPDSVAAMRKFELSGKFNPGYPSNGRPISNYRTLPAGLYVKDRRNNYIAHLDMPDDYIAKYLPEFVCYADHTVDPTVACKNAVAHVSLMDPLMTAALQDSAPPAPRKDAAPAEQQKIVDQSVQEKVVETPPVDSTVNTNVVVDNPPKTVDLGNRNKGGHNGPHKQNPNHRN